jgi:hypothetical protein
VALAHDEPHRRLVVGHRVRVGHGAHGREPARRRRPGAGGDRLHVLATGLSEVTVHVDEAGRDDEVGAVDHLGALRDVDPGAHVVDQTVDQHDVADRVESL